jgi:23S rRNA (cytidine2498-2'-O)-methyltransferase
MPTRIIACCRAGFEPEAALDLRTAISHDAALAVDVKPGEGFVVATSTRDAGMIDRASTRDAAVFVRTAFVGEGPVAIAAPGSERQGGPRADRVTPLLQAIDALSGGPPHAPPWREIWVEHADTNEGKRMSTLARALQPRLHDALERRGSLAPDAARRLHVFLVDGSCAYLGSSDAQRGPRWPLGIPRLHMPGAAPSRSTLKLAEAFVVFLGDDAARVLRPGMRAVDLGAAPGGWSWQLAQRGLRVTAVDNGALKGPVASDPLVQHVRADGLSWRPRKPVDWMVCDMVLAPARIADLVARWIADGDARRAIFNLKLPMKKRYEAVDQCREIVEARLATARIRHTLALRHLYHDREEVTGYVERLG